MSTATNTAAIIDLLAEVAGTDEVRKQPQLRLYDMQVLDSMRTVELVLALDHRLGVQVSPAELDREAWATPELFVSDVQTRLASA